jgi:UDP-glucuronate decarboxylase
MVYQALPADDPTRRCPDIGLAKKHLNWEPTTFLRNGLSATIHWFRSIDLQQFRPPTPNY